MLINLLNKANEAIKENENFNFEYADMHANLKFILNNPFNGKYVKSFKMRTIILTSLLHI